MKEKRRRLLSSSAVADSKGGDSEFVNKSPFLVYKEYSSLWAFAINDDGADTLSSVASPTPFFKFLGPLLVLWDVWWAQVNWKTEKNLQKIRPPPQPAVRARRTCGSVGANTGEIGEAINAGSSVLTRLAVALVYLALTVSTCVAGIADAREIVSSIDARSVNARHADTVITVHLAASAVVTWPQFQQISAVGEAIPLAIFLAESRLFPV